MLSVVQWGLRLSGGFPDPSHAGTQKSARRMGFAIFESQILFDLSNFWRRMVLGGSFGAFRGYSSFLLDLAGSVWETKLLIQLVLFQLFQHIFQLFQHFL